MMQRPRVQQSPQPVSTQVTPISTAMSQRPDTGMMRRPPENGTWLQQHPNGGILAQGQRPQQQTGYQQQNPYANIQSYSQ